MHGADLADVMARSSLQFNSQGGVNDETYMDGFQNRVRFVVSLGAIRSGVVLGEDHRFGFQDWHRCDHTGWGLGQLQRPSQTLHGRVGFGTQSIRHERTHFIVRHHMLKSYFAPNY